MREHRAERPARGFTCWGQFVAMLFCHLGRAQSLREICGGLAASEDKLRHLGLLSRCSKAPLQLRIRDLTAARHLVSFIAASRTREVGIRIALGATKANIGRLIVSDGLRITLFGVGTGVLLSAAVGRLLASLLFGVRSFDVEAVAVLGLASTTAALIPAWRSSQVQPMTALRAE